MNLIKDEDVAAVAALEEPEDGDDDVDVDDGWKLINIITR